MDLFRLLARLVGLSSPTTPELNKYYFLKHSLFCNLTWPALDQPLNQAIVKVLLRKRYTRAYAVVARERPMHMLIYTIFLNHLISLFRFDSWRQEES